MKNFNTFLITIAALLLLFTPRSMNAQTELLIPQNPEDYFPPDPNYEVENTGVAVTQIGTDDMYVMCWEGEEPGFGWFYQGNTGFMPFINTNPDIDDPDVVVYADLSINQVLAYFIYEENGEIKNEIWEYDIPNNQWNIFQNPQVLDYGLNSSPNIDQYYGSVVGVWSENNTIINGFIGEIDGTIYSMHTYFEGHQYEPLIEPDVALFANDDYYYFTITSKQVDDQTTTLWAADYLHVINNQPQFNNIPYVLMTENSDAIEYGTPRIAYDLLPNYSISNYHPYQVVCTERKMNDMGYMQYYVHGFNHVSTSGQNYDDDILNEDEYISQIDYNHYVPLNYPTKEPVVSFKEDIHVAWAYQSPETGSYEIISRRLRRINGEVIKEGVPPNQYPDHYSLVNGYYTNSQKGDQLHPCIASRFSDGTKMIGWYDLYALQTEYKIRGEHIKIFSNTDEFEPGLLFPNPADKFLELKKPDNCDSYIYKIYTINGRLVQSSQSAEDFHSIDVSSFAKGIYLVRINTGNEIITHKFIKQ